jgi:hypothetical protein
MTKCPSLSDCVGIIFGKGWKLSSWWEIFNIPNIKTDLIPANNKQQSAETFRDSCFMFKKNHRKTNATIK